MIENARFLYGQDGNRSSVYAVVDGRALVAPISQDSDDYKILLASGVPIADPGPPSAPPASFLARDLLALLTPADRIAIDRALRARDPATGDLTQAAATLTLIWEALQAQGDAPIRVTSERCQFGFVALASALGETRADELAAALGIAASE